MEWTAPRRDLVLAVGAFPGGMVLLVAGAYSSIRPGSVWPVTSSGFPGQLLIGPLFLVCAGVALRRRAPLWTLGLGTVGFVADIALGGSLATVMLYTDNLYSACVYGPRRLGRRILYVATPLTILLGAIVFVLGRHLGNSVILMAILAIVIISPVLTAMIVRQHRDRAEAESIRADQVARLAEMDRRAAVAAERTRMARELHDVIANHFSVITLQSAAALSRPDLDTQTVRGILATIRENGVQGLDEMRTMIDVLRVDGDDLPATYARLSEAQGLIERAGGGARLETHGDPEPLPPAIELAAYRIIQESLTNALKHSDDQEVRVRVDYRPEAIELLIENAVNGTRAAGVPGAGAGLTGMRERAELLGGEFTAGPSPYGWRVHARLPKGTA